MLIRRRPSAATLVALFVTLVIGTQASLAAQTSHRQPRHVATLKRAGDSAAPQRVRVVDVTSADTSSVTVAWSRSRDNVAVTGYGVYLDGKQRATTPETTYGLTALACGTGYIVGIDAFDAAGNRSSRTSTTVSTNACADLVAPSAPTGIQRVASSETSVVLEWAPSSDDVGVVEYGLYVSGLRVGAVNEPAATVSNLECGRTYSLGVDAVDAAGNHSATSNVFFATAACADRVAPSAPAGLAVTDATQTGISLTWSASADNVGVTGYGRYVAASRVGTTTGTAATFGSLQCSTTYTLSVDATDAAGNRSALSSLTAATDPCTPSSGGDTTAPTAPKNPSVASATQTQIVVRWDAATDNVGVVNYRIYRDGTKIGEGPGTSGGLTNQWTDANRTCGTTYQYAIEAQDAAGNTGPKATLTAATAACDQPPPPSGSDTTAPTAPGNVTASTRTATSIALTWSQSTDNVAVSGYGLYKAGTRIATTSGTTGIVSGLTCGTNYTLGVDAYDAAGNRSTQSVVMVSTTSCSDTVPPSTPTGLTAANLTQTSLSFTWAASSDNVGVTGYDVYRNGSKLATVSTLSSDQTGLTCGTAYTLAVAARDAAGNQSPPAQLVVTTPACSTQTTSSTISGSQCTSTASASGAVIQNVTVTGACSVTGANVTIRNATLQGGIEFDPSASGSSLLGSTTLYAHIFGADNVTFDGSTIDCQGKVKDGTIIWDEPAGNAPQGFVIRNSTYENCKDVQPDDHSQAIYVGYSGNGLIESTTFTNNGSTSHIFFTWFGNLADPATSYPRNICVRGNTFGPTAGAYFDVNFRSEIPSSANIKIQRDASNTNPEFYGDC